MSIAFFWHYLVDTTTVMFWDKPRTFRLASSTTCNRNKLLASSTSLIQEVRTPHMSFTSSHRVTSPTTAWYESLPIWWKRLPTFRTCSSWLRPYKNNRTMTKGADTPPWIWRQHQDNGAKSLKFDEEKKKHLKVRKCNTKHTEHYTTRNTIIIWKKWINLDLMQFIM